MDVVNLGSSVRRLGSALPELRGDPDSSVTPLPISLVLLTTRFQWGGYFHSFLLFSSTVAFRASRGIGLRDFIHTEIDFAWKTDLETPRDHLE
jgi:hypothetical protein